MIHSKDKKELLRRFRFGSGLGIIFLILIYRSVGEQRSEDIDILGSDVLSVGEERRKYGLGEGEEDPYGIVFGKGCIRISTHVVFLNMYFLLLSIGRV